MWDVSIRGGRRAWQAPTLALTIACLAWWSTPARADGVTISCVTANAENIAAGLATSAGYTIGVGIEPTTGALSVSNNTLQLPPNGVICVSQVTCATSSRSLTFARNAANTPVYLLVEGNVTLASASCGVDVSGTSQNTRFGLGMDRIGGRGGPGGSDGGSCDFQHAVFNRAGEGVGPGGGRFHTYGTDAVGPGGGGASPIADGGPGYSDPANNLFGAAGGVRYSAFDHRILHGGSGGACGANGITPSTWHGGGGGGGVLVLGVGGTVNLSHSSSYLRARGGQGSTWGGGGGGGVIRIVADVVMGNGLLQADGSNGITTCGTSAVRGGCGGHGMVKIEAPDGGATGNLLSNVSPPEALHFGVPQAIVPQARPTLAVATVTATWNQSQQTVAPLQLNPAEHVHTSAGVFLEAPSPEQTVTITLSSMNVPHTAPVWVRMNVLGHPSVLVAASTAGEGTGPLTWTASHAVPAGMELGTIEAWIENVCTPGSPGCP